MKNFLLQITPRIPLEKKVFITKTKKKRQQQDGKYKKEEEGHSNEFNLQVAKYPQQGGSSQFKQ